MSIDWSKAPEGATHVATYRDPSGLLVFYKQQDGKWFDVKNQEWSYVGGKPNFDLIERPKTITQAVFDGLPSEYRWAVTDFCGEVFALSGEKPELNAQKNDWHFCGKDYLLILCKYGDATDWQNSVIERQDVPTAADIDWAKADIDWANAPEGATHWHDGISAWYKIADDSVFVYNDYYDVWVLSAYEISGIDLSPDFITRPESIHDVARSIEAARVAEPERKHGHYFKDVSSIAQIDVYSVLRLFEVTDPCLQHIVKKALCAGKRGAKDFARDVQEIADTAARLIELESGK